MAPRRLSYQFRPFLIEMSPKLTPIITLLLICLAAVVPYTIGRTDLQNLGQEKRDSCLPQGVRTSRNLCVLRAPDPGIKTGSKIGDQGLGPRTGPKAWGVRVLALSGYMFDMVSMGVQ